LEAERERRKELSAFFLLWFCEVYFSVSVAYYDAVVFDGLFDCFVSAVNIPWVMELKLYFIAIEVGESFGA
jgi:hypothetical protein